MTPKLGFLFWPGVNSIFRWDLFDPTCGPKWQKGGIHRGEWHFKWKDHVDHASSISIYVNIVRRPTMTPNFGFLFWPAIDSIFRWDLFDPGSGPFLLQAWQATWPPSLKAFWSTGACHTNLLLKFRTILCTS